mmetsp:Transcript_89339/g.266455  ORF Transcript_89339/g.266455 Transcript_89339/m.266455 type:complete len:222 (+) Transcript_89339:145-810(+)
MTMKAMAAMDTPNIVWCSLVSLSRTLEFDCDSWSKCLSITSGEWADLCTSAMSEWRLSSFLCLSLVSEAAAVEREDSSRLMEANSSLSLCPLFLSISCFSSAKFLSMVPMRLPNASMAWAICERMGCVSTTSLKTMLVRSLIASDSARWSLWAEVSRRTSSVMSSALRASASGTAFTSFSAAFALGSLLLISSSCTSTLTVFTAGSWSLGSREPPNVETPT